ncbi:hypothetical protein ABVK25_001211 [Lepraria finkii]|uniref:Uncharacterized protein n=1 Tax=Lepraria finkii TaxID=1340010 RepID=A0ABR4BKZ8_9LECA
MRESRMQTWLALLTPASLASQIALKALTLLIHWIYGDDTFSWDPMTVDFAQGRSCSDTFWCCLGSNEGVSRSRTAVPSARNSGFETISKRMPGLALAESYDKQPSQWM